MRAGRKHSTKTRRGFINLIDILVWFVTLTIIFGTLILISVTKQSTIRLANPEGSVQREADMLGVTSILTSRNASVLDGMAASLLAPRVTRDGQFLARDIKTEDAFLTLGMTLNPGERVQERFSTTAQCEKRTRLTPPQLVFLARRMDGYAWEARLVEEVSACATPRSHE